MSISTLESPIAIAPLTSMKLRVPRVSVIIPSYNEERFIGNALKNLADQYPATAYEIVVVDGLSTDGTRDVIAKFQESHPWLTIKVIDNPDRNIPRALNLGIRAARGEIIARIDAHAAPSGGYIRRCVEVLGGGEGQVVGMPCRVQPGSDTLMARAIAIAVSHPFGIGDAKYRLRDSSVQRETVDTVAFACFRKSLWSELGGFDEDLLTNEDYDFNYRVRLRGGHVLLDRSEHCDYFARTTLAALSKQYLRYGAWKARMIRLHPRSIKLRHLIAPVFVGSIVALAVLGQVNALAWRVLGIELATYLAAAITFGYRATRKNDEGWPVMLVLPFVFLTIHVSWGASFLTGIVRPPR